MRDNLTDRTLKALQKKPAPPGGRYDVWDTGQPGFGVRINEKGRCIFVVAKRLAGAKNPTRFSVGEYPALSLAEARMAARKIADQLEEGVSPRERREAKAREEARRRQDTFASVADDFIKRHVSKLRTAGEVENAIRRELIGRWGNRPITDITRRDVIAMLEETVDRGSPYVAYHLLAYTRKLWNWSIAREAYGLESSPCDRISAVDVIGERKPRNRILSDHEIRLIWNATAWPREHEGLGYPVAPLVRLLLITGQRLREVAEARWREVDFERALLTIPAPRMKGESAHEVPLSPMAVELLSRLPRFTAGDFIFTTTGGARPVSGFSKFKDRVDAALASLAEGEPVSAWRFHDLRRTMRTHLSALPVQDMVRELVIAHARPELHQVYDLHAYREEKRQALDLWAARLRSIAERAPENVVPLRAHA